MKLALFVLVAGIGLAQTGTDQTGGITGVVTDAISHLPVKKTTVSANGMLSPFGVSGNMGANQGGHSVVTDESGAFTINNLAPGRYQLVFQQQNYPQSRFGGGVVKMEEVKAGETAGPVSVELTPGAAVSGHVVDEDGDPLPGCNVQLHPAKNPQQGVPMAGVGNSNEDGEYRLYIIPPGQYVLAARCGRPMFQPRPFSAGPEPPPTSGYPTQYYPLTTDPKGAQAVDLTPGAEKSGVDFQMRPSALTQVHVAFSPSGADWHDSGPLMARMMPVDSTQPAMGVFATPDPKNGTYQFRQVFPGSYMLTVFSNGVNENRIGAMQRVEVGNRPVDLVLELRHAIGVSGTVEIDSSGNNNDKLKLNQVGVQLIPEYQVGMPGAASQVNDDGSFTLKSVIPGLWTVRANAPFAYIESVWFGNADVTDAPIDLSNGAGGALRIVMSTNTATIRGSAPAGQFVYLQRLDDKFEFRSYQSSQADQSGQYKVENLAPGKYRLMVVDSGMPMPDEGGQEVTLHEGETVMLDLKAQTAP